MAVIDLNLEPTNRQLRQFGLIALFAMPIIGWLYLGKPTPSTWEPIHIQRLGLLVVVGMAFGVVGWIRPSLLKWIFIGLSVITFPIGFVLGEVIMLTIYSIAFVPVAVLFRCIRRDALQRKIDRSGKTYWQRKDPARSTKSYYRQS